MPQTSPLASAGEMIRQGRHREALTLLEDNRIHPDCAVRLRELYLGEHDNENALRIARQLAVGTGEEAHVSRSVVALINGDLEAAVSECEHAIGLDPNCASAFNHLGRALQNANHSLQAVSNLRKAVDLQDDYPEAWYNLALVLRATGAMEEAIKAYRRAVELAPGYRSAELNLGLTLLLMERVSEALFCFEEVLSRFPDDVEALVHAGLAQHQLGQFRQAQESFERAIALDSQHPLAWCYLGILLHELQEDDAAIEALETALKIDPMMVEGWVELASVHEQANRVDQARDALLEAGRADPRHPAVALEAARLLKREGDKKAALKALQSIPAGDLPLRMAQQYWFELGQLLDRNGQYDAAIEAFNTGNSLMAYNIRRRDVDPDGFERRCASLDAWLDAGAPGAFSTETGTDELLGEGLCFLVGFPRSGTTLLDTMLDAHPDVASIEERPTLETVIDELRSLPGGYPANLAALDEERVAALRGMYFESCRQALDGELPALLVDKLPLRFLNAGLIHRLFPRARILFALRHPCDVVLSNFMQAYAVNEAFIHFDTLAESAAMYNRAMNLWHRLESLLPLKVFYTKYEDMVVDQRAEMVRVCDFLGLEPVEAMFDVDQRMAERPPVRTNSYQQVSEPVYGRAAGRWLRYAQYFQPYLGQLGPHIERLGYPAVEEVQGGA